MSTLTIQRSTRLHGTLTVPGDKSISHRVLILGSLARGQNRVRGWLEAGDTLATLGAMRSLGIDVQRRGNDLTFRGGMLSRPLGHVNCRNAGTAMRLLAGLLAGQPFETTLDGSEQLRKRPMRRVVDPLRTMGANITDSEGRAPLTIRPALLVGMEHQLPIASAQVKSAILLAGLQAQGATTVIEPGPSRDHTERMLAAMGASIAVNGSFVTVESGQVSLAPLDMTIPGDMSSAAFLIVAASLLPGSTIQIDGVGLNPTRTGLLDALHRMGADISIEATSEEAGEPVGTLRICGSALRGTEVGSAEVVRAIDELPILAVAATQADGETVIRDAAELRVKEVDRIGMLAQELRKLGAEIDEQPDGMIVHGPTPLTGARVNSHGDHRMGMALAVAGLVAEGETCVEEADSIGDSYPGFAESLSQLGAEIA